MRWLWKCNPKCSSEMCLTIFVLFYFHVFFFLKLTLRVNRVILLALVCCSFNGAQLTEHESKNYMKNVILLLLPSRRPCLCPSLQLKLLHCHPRGSEWNYKARQADRLCDMKLPHDEHMTAFYTSDPMLQSGAMCSYYSLKATCARQHLLMLLLFFWISFFFFFLPDSSVCVNLGLFLFLTFRLVPLFNKACDILPSVALQQQRGVNLSLQSRRSRQYVVGISSVFI